MQLTTAQLQTLAADIAAQTDSEFVGYRTNGNDAAMAGWYNVLTSFVARRKMVLSSEIGPVLNYVAVSNLTTANRDRATTFIVLNPASFAPTSDVESYWDTTFGGTLGGQGQATRDALMALWRRTVKRGERIYCTGTGTSAAPGTLGPEGDITSDNISQALRPQG